MIRTLFLALMALLLATGCSGVRDIQVPEDDGDWVSEMDGAGGVAGSHPDRMYTRRKEGKYVIKPEPYSVKSKKKDPELLGPQRTYRADTSSQTKTATTTARKKSTKMTKASCISLIGEAKYNSYVKKYGGTKGALRRCLIIKRLRG